MKIHHCLVLLNAILSIFGDVKNMQQVFLHRQLCALVEPKYLVVIPLDMIESVLRYTAFNIIGQSAFASYSHFLLAFCYAKSIFLFCASWFVYIRQKQNSYCMRWKSIIDFVFATAVTNWWRCFNIFVNGWG